MVVGCITALMGVGIDMDRERIKVLISLYEGFVSQCKDLSQDVRSEYLEGCYEGKVKAYNFVISDLKDLLGDNND